MKNKRTLSLDKNHKIIITKKENGSNYDQFVSVFKIGETNPLFGTCFKNTVEDSQIKNWALTKIILNIDEVLLILGNISFEENKAIVHEIHGLLYLDKKSAIETGENLCNELQSYLIPSIFQGMIEYECNPEIVTPQYSFK